MWNLPEGGDASVRFNLKGFAEYVPSVSLSPDDKYIVGAGGDNGTISVWDALTGDRTWVLRGHSACVISVVWSADGKHIVRGCDKVVRVWDADVPVSVYVA